MSATVLSSWSRSTSGPASFSQASTLGRRALIELTFQVAILTMASDCPRGIQAKRKARLFLGGPWMLAGLAGLVQIENEAPQPQDEVALGFLTWKEAPTSSST